MPNPIYLDYAATTPVDPRVAERMAACLTRDGLFGNPASGHGFGRQALAAVEQARAQVAALLKAHPSEILWTSGATEANNLAIQGVARASTGRHLVTCATEHKAVLDVCRVLEGEGYAVSYLSPGPDGRLEPAALASALRPDTALVSIMHVNNETGVVQDLAAIGRLTRERGIPLHVDAAQSAGKLPIDVSALPVDLLSLCAHKVYGPKGVGALYLRRRAGIALRPLLYGGGQERGLRAGTLATHQLVGGGEALAIAAAGMADEDRRLRALRARLWEGLRGLGGVHLNGTLEHSVAGILNISFEGLAGEDLLLALPELALSSGSACNSATRQASHVLRAMGRSDELADGALRFSLGRYSTGAEIDHAVTTVARALNKLRGGAPNPGAPSIIERRTGL